MQNLVVNILGFPHHGKNIGGMVGSVGISFSIAVGVVHPVQDGVSAWAKERRTLGYISKGKKEFFPKFIHHKHAMGGITMQKEGLRKE
jgi:hypothetical protein